MLKTIISRALLFNPLYALQNPFKGILGPNHAPHSKTLNRTFWEKRRKSSKVIHAFLMNFVNLPLFWIRQTLRLVSDLLDAIPVLRYPLMLVTYPLGLINDYGLPYLKSGISKLMELVAFTLSLVALVITVPVHLISNAVYNKKAQAAGSLAGTGAEYSHKTSSNGSSQPMTLAQAQSKTNDSTVKNVNLERVTHGTTTYQITKQFDTKDNRLFVYKSEPFNLVDAIKNPKTPTEIAVSNLISLNPTDDIEYIAKRALGDNSSNSVRSRV